MSTPPLLMIASGRKPRPRRAPPSRPKEHVLHMATAKLLREHCLPEWIWFHVPNGELRDARIGAKLKALGVRAGVADIVLVSPYGSVNFLELKRAGETLSEAQETFQLHCIRRGIPYSVADSFDEALAFLDALGCLRIKIGGLNAR
jgi:hypothetical protein